MSLAQARMTDHDDGRSFVQIAAAGQFQHPLLVQTGHTGEVKVGQFLEHREASRLDTAQLTVLLPLGDFLLSQGQ